jgi:hypothetical protein
MATGFGHVAQRVEDRTQRIIALRGILAAKRQIRHYKRPLFIRHIRLIARAVSIPHACIVSYREADRYANANKGIKLITDSSLTGADTDIYIGQDPQIDSNGVLLFYLTSGPGLGDGLLVGSLGPDDNQIFGGNWDINDLSGGAMFIVTPTPEPRPLLLLGTGLLGIAVFLFRKAKSQ